MKKLIGSLLALLLLCGCAGQAGNAGAGPATDAVTETWDFYIGNIYSIRYELGDLKGNFTLTPTKARDGNLVKIRSQVLTDADIHLYLDGGSEIDKSRSDGDCWEYAFTMPERDVVITAEPYTEIELRGFEGTDMDFIRGVRYVRTDLFDYEGTQPTFFWISSAEELQAYEQENFRGMTGVLGQYDDAFFAENDLMVVVKTEGSGSNSHELTGVKVSPSQTEGKQYVLQPEIKRLVPECGTCDMAGWHILITIAKDHGAAVSELDAPVFTTVTIAG